MLPDLSLMARARGALAARIQRSASSGGSLLAQAGGALERIISMSCLQGYKPALAGMKISENNWYNPYFVFGAAIAMAESLDDGIVDYTDGSPQIGEQYARDVSAFLMWTVDPPMERRKKPACA